MAPKEEKRIELDVFTNRGQKLNRAIINLLDSAKPQTTRQIWKQITSIREFKGISYSTINKRVRDLESKGYIRKAQVKERPGGITNLYELCQKAYLAKFLYSKTVPQLFENISDEAAQKIHEVLKTATRAGSKTNTSSK